MTSRRSFIGILAAGAAALGLPIVGRRSFGTPAAKVDGPPARKGVPGVTYFRAAEHDIPPDTRLYLNGRNVTGEASEADLAAGWVRLWPIAERHPDGSPARFATNIAGDGLAEYVAFGRVELRPRLPGDPPTSREWIRHKQATRQAYVDVARYSSGGWKAARVPVTPEA